MNYGRFFMPNMVNNFNPMMSLGQFSNGPNIGILGKLTNSIRRFNWSGLITGANKTLNAVNQTIPLIRQTGPMINNMKKMFRIAKAFGNETSNKSNSVSPNNDKLINSVDNLSKKKKEEVTNDNYPNFFI